LVSSHKNPTFDKFYSNTSIYTGMHQPKHSSTAPFLTRRINANILEPKMQCGTGILS